jgi:hypothetical protein
MRGKRTEFGREDAFVVDGSLGVRHDVVDVLRRRQSDLLTSFVNPRILSTKHKAKQNKTKQNKTKNTLEQEKKMSVIMCVFIIHQKTKKVYKHKTAGSEKERRKVNANILRLRNQRAICQQRTRHVKITEKVSNAFFALFLMG